MNELVRRKAPAQVMPGQIVKLASPRRRDVLDELRRRSRRGEVAEAGDLHLIQRGPQAGWYAMDVRLLPARRTAVPRWARRLIIAGLVLTLLAGLVLLGMWLAVSLSGAPFALLLVTLLAAFCLWVKARHAPRSKGPTVTVVVNVR